MRLPDYEAWAIFESVARLGSFTAAARELSLSKATVSKAVSRLERSLGASLFNRTTRTITLTQAGKRLAGHAAALVAEGEAAEHAAHEEAEEPAGLVRLAAPMSFGLAFLGDLLSEFLCEYRRIDIDLHLADARIDLVREGYDLALRIAALPDSSLRARKLAPIARHLVAAPSYLTEHGEPRHPSELERHACFCYSNLPNPDIWHFIGPSGEEASVRPAGRMRANNADVMLPALCAGKGIALLPEFICRGAVESGGLAIVLAGWHSPEVALHLLMPPSRYRPRRIELLAGFLAERLPKLCARQD